ncbi:MAG: extracellular solute-binding protein [Clostridiales bacterium]|jgi:putative aldouronate transport system substrate-binding protein|nr:extracellular solute-binding protein [Clostridiales bacterium]
MKQKRSSSLKRIVGLSLAFLLAASLAACASNNGTNASSDQSAATDASSSESDTTTSDTSSGQPADNDPYGKYDPPINLSWGINTSAVQQFKDGDTYENNIWTRKYLEDLGINVTVAFTADGSTEAYRNQMNLALASGDLPDVFKTNDYVFIKQAYDAGYLADLSQVYKDYANDFMAMVQPKYPDSYDYATIDGKLIGIPQLQDNSQFGILLWIRDDWLANLGKEAPKTVDELVALARAFTFDDPDGNGVDDTFGLGINKNLVTSNYCTLLGFIGSFGVPGFDHSIYYRNDAGEMTFSYLEPGMKDALAVLQSMYAEGIIDREFSVKDTAMLEQDIGSGKLGMAFGMQWGTWLPWNLAFQNEQAIAHPYPIPTQEGYTARMGIQSNAFGDITMVNANYKNPEALVKLYNVYSDTVNPDMDDETYAIYDADEQYRFSPAVINEPQEPTYGPWLKEAQLKNDASDLPRNLITRFNTIKDFDAGSNTGSDAYGLWGQYSLGGSMPIINDFYVPNNMLIQSVVGGVQPDSLVKNSSVLEKITLQAFTEIIMGADIDNFDKYVQDWLAAGGQQVLEDLDKQYPAE